MNSRLNLIQTLLYPSGFQSGLAGLALLGLRVFVGLAFIQHGLGKWHDLPGFANEFSIPEWMAATAAASQIIAAYALIAGIATPLAALTIGSNMLVAVTKLVGRGETFVNPHGHSWEAAGFYALAGFSLYLLGPGVTSIDYKLLAGRGTARG